MSIIHPIKRRKLTLEDGYKEFLAGSGKPKDTLSNPLNLFDDSNKKDKLWLGIAKNYLARVR